MSRKTAQTTQLFESVYTSYIKSEETYARPNAKQEVIPIFSARRVFKFQTLCIGSAIMIKSPIALVAIKD